MPIQEAPGSAKGAGSATAFLPTSIAGCQLWMDAADTSTGSMTLSGSTVTVWKDKSGNGNTTTARSGTSTLVSSAINGLSAISMAGGYFTGPFATANTGTQLHAFAVLTIDSSSGMWPRPFSLGRPGANDYSDSTTTFAIIRYSGGQAVGIGRAGQYLSASFPNYSSPFIVQSSHNGATEYMSVNGNLTVASANTGQTGTFNITSYGLGVNTNTGDYFAWNGYYAEVIYYNVQLSLADRQAVEGYLAQKWGLTSLLPPGHPGITTNYLATAVVPFSITSAPRPSPVFTITEKSLVQPAVLTTTTFAATGAAQTFSVPATTTSINVFMWGAAGGGGYISGNTAKAGAGAYLQGTLAVTPNTTLTLVVGKGGIMAGTTTTYGGGGKGVSGNTCGSGGGRSAIQFTAGTDVVTVAGGGGGGYYGLNGTGGAGDATTGTGTAGSAGAGGNAIYGGKGGSTLTSSGGAAGTDIHSGAPGAGTLYQGGDGSTYSGAGGGGGYYGGGGGGAGEPIGGGGGGGSSLTSALTNFVGYNSPDGYSTPYAGIYNPSSIYGAAGGPGSTGGDGRIVLVYYQ